MQKQAVAGENFHISSLKLRFAEIQKRIKNLKVCLAGIEISSAIVQEVRASREALHRFFVQSSYQKLCSNCFEGCCMGNDYGDYGQHLLPYELIYFAAIGYDLPIPDWEFLGKEAFRARPWCLFMGPSGCLLKENRRLICLRYYCKKLYGELKKEEQHSQFIVLGLKLKMATIAFSQEVLEKLGSRLDEKTLLFLQFFITPSKALPDH